MKDTEALKETIRHHFRKQDAKRLRDLAQRDTLEGFIYQHYQDEGRNAAHPEEDDV